MDSYADDAGDDDGFLDNGRRGRARRIAVRGSGAKGIERVRSRGRGRGHVGGWRGCGRGKGRGRGRAGGQGGGALLADSWTFTRCMNLTLALSTTFLSILIGQLAGISLQTFNQLVNWIFPLFFANTDTMIHILYLSSYASPGGSWKGTTAEEVNALLSLFIYFGLVQVQDAMDYWGRRPLYNGLWARRMLSRNRF